MNILKSSSSRQAVVQFLIGVALINIADSLNKAGQVNWGTVFISFVGIFCVLTGVKEYFSRKK